MSEPRFEFTSRARPIAQLGIGDSRINAEAGQWDVSLWDDPLAIWGGDEPAWRNVSCDTFSFECEFGRSRTVDRFVPGTATLMVRNLDGWADPNNNDEVSPLTMRPGRPVRVGVEHEVYGPVWFFRGITDEISPTYDPWATDVVEIRCVDALGDVNRARFSANPPDMAPVEMAHERINRILDKARWPRRKRAIDVSSWAVIAASMEGQSADLLSKTADSVGGALFGDTSGVLNFRPMDWQTYDPALTPVDAVIGNVEPGDVCPGKWIRPFDRGDIATRTIMGRSPEESVTLDDEVGQIMYGIEPFERTDLWTEDDARLQTLASRALETRNADTAPRVRSVFLDARNGDAQLDLMTLADVYKPSRYRCRLKLPRGLVFDDEYFATGMLIRMDAHEWSVEMNLDLSAPYAAVQSRWDEAKWDVDTWVDDPFERVTRWLDGIEALVAQEGTSP